MIRVGIVEDHASFRQALATVFSLSPDLRVAFELGRGDVAALLAAAPDLDVVVVDLDLSGADGVELVSALRGVPQAPACLVLTGLKDDRELGRAVEAGAAAVLHKATPMPELMEALRVVASGGVVLPPEETGRRLRAVERDRRRRRRARVLAEQLTARELEVLEHLVYGESNAQVATRLDISPETVQTHIRNLMRKLQASSRLHAVSLALQHELVDPP